MTSITYCVFLPDTSVHADILGLYYRRKKKKKKERKNNYQTIDRVHRELEVVTYPRRIPVTVAYRTNQAYSDSELSDPPFLGNPSTMWPMFTDHHEVDFSDL